MDLLISNLLSESIFDFRMRSNGKYANTHIMYFQFDHFSKSKTDSKSRFEMMGRVFIFGQKNSEKAKQTKIFPSFCGNMPEAQFGQVPVKAPHYMVRNHQDGYPYLNLS